MKNRGEGGNTPSIFSNPTRLQRGKAAYAKIISIKTGQ
jgi:hypothetical protein